MAEAKEEVRRALAAGVIPAGIRFIPSEKELLLYYLPRRASNSWLPNGFIVDFNIYECNPWDLPRDLFIYQWEQKEMYFFTRLRRMSSSSCSKPKSNTHYARTAGSGVWHGNGQDVTVKDDEDGRVVGHSTSFTFMVFVNNDDGDDKKKKKKKKQHIKTDWIMHEYKLHSTASTSSSDNADLVVCKIYEKSKRKESTSHEGVTSWTATSEGEDVIERMQEQYIINRKRFTDEPSNPSTLVPSADDQCYHDPQAICGDSHQGEEIMAEMAPAKRGKVDEHESNFSFTFTFTMPSINYHQQQPNSLDAESVPQDDGIATFLTQTNSSSSTFATPTENQKMAMINNASEHEILNPENANYIPEPSSSSSTRRWS